jgi:hypothetical protein
MAAHTLSGWAGPDLSSVPVVDLAAGGYASAGVEWRNGTDDGSNCAPVVEFQVALPSGGAATVVPAGEPSLTDGPACAMFKIHPVVAGFAPDYFLDPADAPPTSGG